MENVKNIIKGKLVYLSIFIIMFTVNISFAARDYMYILKFDKGEMFNDFDPQKVEMSLSKEHAKDGKVSMKLVFKTNAGIGELKPTRAIWTGYSKVKFCIYNDSNEERELVFRVKGAKEPPNAPSNTYDVKLKLPPGESEHTINLTEAVCNDGVSRLDISRIYLYAFSNRSEKPLTIYVSDFKLVK